MSELEKITDGEEVEISCKNCQTVYTGNYCPNCGQSKREYDKPFRFIIADFAGDLFAFDTRFWETFKAILFHPGKVAADFIEGKRARYMPPFRLYVFSSFVFFLLLSYTTSFDKSLNFNAVDKDGNAVSVSFHNDSSVVTTSDTTLALDSLVKNTTPLDSVLTINDRKIDFADIRNHPDRYFDKFLKWMSTTMFFLMPIYGFLLWLFFRKSYRYYMGHLVLALNQHVFAFLVFTSIMLVGMPLPEAYFNPTSLLVLTLPIYFTMGVKEVYNQTLSSAFWRLTAIWLIYLVISAASIFIIIYYSVTSG